MSEPKRNCWEFMQCGREPGGHRVEESGVCPASIASEHNGRNGGTNGGRYCWATAGTFCGGKVQGTFAHKLGDCTQCFFYREVEAEEERWFVVYARAR